MATISAPWGGPRTPAERSDWAEALRQAAGLPGDWWVICGRARDSGSFPIRIEDGAGTVLAQADWLAYESRFRELFRFLEQTVPVVTQLRRK